MVRINESGTVHEGGVTVKIEAHELEVETDPIVLGAGPADAIAKTIADGIRGVQTMAPNRKHRKWNVTGRLANSVQSTPDGKGYAIVVAQDRLETPDLVEKLAADVPAVDNPLTSLVDEAIAATIDHAIRLK